LILADSIGSKSPEEQNVTPGLVLLEESGGGFGDNDGGGGGGGADNMRSFSESSRVLCEGSCDSNVAKES
jgi:hypothetical protein